TACPPAVLTSRLTHVSRRPAMTCTCCVYPVVVCTAEPKGASPMKTVLSSAALLLMASPAWANITVTGHGKIKYTPNVSYVTVTASSDAPTAAAAWHKNSEIVQRMFQVLADFGIDEKDFKTAGVRITPRYDHPKDKAPVLVGYTVSYDLAVTVRDLKKLGKILDRLVDAGANRGMQIAFGMDNPEELLDQARMAAVAEARKKAD